MRDHGGNIDEAQARFGGTGWLDLSTGINRVPYPVPAFAPEVWTALPSRSDLASLLDVARGAYRTTAPMLAVAGAQAAIQLIPRLTAPGRARVWHGAHSIAWRSVVVALSVSTCASLRPPEDTETRIGPRLSPWNFSAASPGLRCVILRLTHILRHS